MEAEKNSRLVCYLWEPCPREMESCYWPKCSGRGGVAVLGSQASELCLASCSRGEVCKPSAPQPHKCGLYPEGV